MQVWDTDAGLPDSLVTSIAQTPDGYLWVGTLHGGLARFDGSRFVNFDPGNTPELKSIEIHKLLVDASGTLWIANVEGGLIAYRDGRFHFDYWNNDTPRAWVEKIVAEPPGKIEFASRLGMFFRRTQMGATNRWEAIAPPNGWPAPDFFADAGDAIWYRMLNGQLAQLHGASAVVLTNPPGLSSPKVTALTKDAAGRIWVATTNHLAYWDGTTFVDMTPTNGPPDFNVQWMIACPKGGFWIQTQGYLRKYEGRQWTVIENLVTNGVTKEWLAGAEHENFTLMFADSEGGAWFYRQHDGLGHISNTGQISWVLDGEGLSLGPVSCWFEDHEGNVWVGLHNGGLARLRPRLFHEVWPRDNVDSKAAASVCQDEDGVMWFGTGGKTILRWQKGAFKVLEPPGIGYFQETKVLPGGDGSLWVGSVQNGLMKLKDGRFSRPFPAQSVGTVVRCFYRDRQDNLWLGSEFGLFRWDGEELKAFTAKDGFSPAYVLAITGDPAGNLWLGTALGELRCLREGKFQTFLPKDSLTDQTLLKAAASSDAMAQLKRGALSGGERFWQLHFDDQGVLWIGSLGGGLLRFKDGRFTRFTTREDLPSDHVSQILEDDRSQLWLGTRDGIIRADKRELNAYADGGSDLPNFVSYDRNDGMPALKCSGGSQPGCWRSRDGRLWFTTVRGAVWVDPAMLHINRLPPPVHIEDVWVDGTSIMENNNAALRPAALVPTNIRVAAGRHYFEFKFTALSLVSPEKVKFKWRLAGLEKNWVDGGARRTASYSFIPPGDYRFELQACNNDGVWSDASEAVQLTVLPYFWQRWWFKAGCVVLLVVALLLAYSLRIARLREMEKLRLRIARDLHDEVGANLGCISILAQMMEQTPSKSDAVQVWTIASQTIETLREIIWFIDPTHDRLSDLVARLHDTSRVMLQTVPFTFDQTGDFSSVNLPLPFRRNVLPLFKETLHNVIKHSRATAVGISVSRREKEFEFRIQDNGIGFDPGRKSSGNGLQNLKRRAAEIGGRLEIVSRSDGGTTVTLTAPIPQTRSW